MKQVILFKHANVTNEEHFFFHKLAHDLDIDLTEVNDLSQVISFTKILPELDLIATFVNDESVTKIDDLIDNLEKMESKIPLMLFGDYDSTREQTFIFPQLDSLQATNKMNEIFYSNKVKNNSKNISLFIAVNFDFIAGHFQIPFPVNIYLRIKQNAEDFQFVKRLNKNELFTKEEIEKYKALGLENVYITRNEYQDFLQFSQKLILAKIKSTHKTSPKEKVIKDLDYSFHLAAESLMNFGITEENVLVINQNITKMEETISSDQALLDFLKYLKEKPTGFAYAHSYLISLFLSKVVLAFDWDSKAIREKICFVAFFHDITLTEPELCQINDNDELLKHRALDYEFSSNSKKSELVLTFEQIEKVKNHAADAAIMLEKFPNVPMGVAQVVKEHHGAKNGIGFNDGQSISLQPLAMVFLVVEDFVVNFLKIEKPTSQDVQLILIKLKEKYVKGNYRKAITALEEILVPKK